MRNILPIIPETSTLVLEFNFHVVFDVGSSAFYHLKAQQSAASTTSQVRDYFVSEQSHFDNELNKQTVLDPNTLEICPKI